MAIPRVIPVLLLKAGGLVKTVQFKKPVYIGDPLNAVKIFNEKEADELIFLNIDSDSIPFDFLQEIAEECFMPLAYGGGIKTVEDIRAVLKIGMEKVVINSALFEDLGFIREAADQFGSATIVASLDVKKNLFGNYELYASGGKVRVKKDPFAFARELEQAGAGELMLQSIDREGTMKGYDLEFISRISEMVNIPVIASGGAGSTEDFGNVVRQAGASAAAAGSLFVFHGKHRAVLISYPDQQELKRIFSRSSD